MIFDPPTGEPEPTLMWNYEDSVLPASSLASSSYQAGLHTLTLPALAEDQMGNYSCIAQNSLGAYK